MGSPLFQNFDFVFTSSNGQTDDINVEASKIPLPVIGDTAIGFATTAIGGDIGGVAITSQFGLGGVVQTSQSAIFDNTIFGPPSEGAFGLGSTAGIDNGGLEFISGGIEYNLYTANGQFFLFPVGDPSAMQTLTLLCFYPGTMVLTDNGEMAVETLAVGDIAITVDGNSAPIRWIGRRAIAPRFMDPLKVMPIRIKAGALAQGVPTRDLLLSTDHAVLVDGVLAHAGALVNGTSIVRETSTPERFTYYHIELADHALVMANGAAAETFVDNTDRMGFDNWAEYEALVQGEAPILELDLPRAKAHRQVPANVRAMLSTRANALAANEALALSA